MLPPVNNFLQSFKRAHSSPAGLTSLFLIPLVILQIILLVLLIGWEKKRASDEQRAELKEVAAAFFSQIMVARLWNAGHGGVYCEVSPDTQPNPYLEDPERDIVSVDGRVYTKVNPAYMTRQLSEIAASRDGYRFRMVSLRPLNPSNAADEWETDALKQFSPDKPSEAVSLQKGADGARIFKYIAPLKLDAACLKCHAKQGYVQGDIKGGITVYMPMDKSDAIYAAKLRRIIISLILFGGVSIIVTFGITFYLSRRLCLQIGKSIEKEKLAAILEMAGAAAHEMRQPLTVANSMVDLARSKLRDNEIITDEELEIVYSQCLKMDDVIKRMLSITRYRTKNYFQKDMIVDLEASSGEGRARPH